MKYALMDDSNFSTRYVVRRSNNKHLSCIGWLFHEGVAFSEALIEELLDNNSEGLTGELIGILKKEKMAILVPLYFHNPEEYKVEIDSQKLIKIIQKWKEVIETRPPYVLITEENGDIKMQPFQEDIFAKAEK